MRACGGVGREGGSELRERGARGTRLDADGEEREPQKRTSRTRSIPGRLFQTIISLIKGYLDNWLTTICNPFVLFQCNTTAVTPTTFELGLLRARGSNDEGGKGDVLDSMRDHKWREFESWTGVGGRGT